MCEILVLRSDHATEFNLNSEEVQKIYRLGESSITFLDSTFKLEKAEKCIAGVWITTKLEVALLISNFEKGI